MDGSESEGYLEDPTQEQEQTSRGENERDDSERGESKNDEKEILEEGKSTEEKTAPEVPEAVREFSEKFSPSQGWEPTEENGEEYITRVDSESFEMFITDPQGNETNFSQQILEKRGQEEYDKHIAKNRELLGGKIIEEFTTVSEHKSDLVDDKGQFQVAVDTKFATVMYLGANNEIKFLTFKNEGEHELLEDNSRNRTEMDTSLDDSLPGDRHPGTEHSPITIYLDQALMPASKQEGTFSFSIFGKQNERGNFDETDEAGGEQSQGFGFEFSLFGQPEYIMTGAAAIGESLIFRSSELGRMESAPTETIQERTAGSGQPERRTIQEPPLRHIASQEDFPLEAETGIVLSSWEQNENSRRTVQSFKQKTFTVTPQPSTPELHQPIDQQNTSGLTNFAPTLSGHPTMPRQEAGTSFASAEAIIGEIGITIEQKSGETLYQVAEKNAAAGNFEVRNFGQNHVYEQNSNNTLFSASDRETLSMTPVEIDMLPEAAALEATTETATAPTEETSFGAEVSLPNIQEQTMTRDAKVDIGLEALPEISPYTPDLAHNTATSIEPQDKSSDARIDSKEDIKETAASPQLRGTSPVTVEVQPPINIEQGATLTPTKDRTINETRSQNTAQRLVVLKPGIPSKIGIKTGNQSAAPVRPARTTLTSSIYRESIHSIRENNDRSTTETFQKVRAKQTPVRQQPERQTVPVREVAMPLRQPGTAEPQPSRQTQAEEVKATSRQTETTEKISRQDSSTAKPEMTNYGSVVEMSPRDNTAAPFHTNVRNTPVPVRPGAQATSRTTPRPNNTEINRLRTNGARVNGQSMVDAETTDEAPAQRTPAYQRAA